MVVVVGVALMIKIGDVMVMIIFVTIMAMMMALMRVVPLLIMTFVLIVFCAQSFL